MVYIDDKNKAHWVFRVSFSVKTNSIPEKPVFIMDAINFKIYSGWNEVKNLEDVTGGGFGGNKKMGKLVYDGKEGNLPTLDIRRDAEKKICYLANENVTVTDYRSELLAQFNCEKKDSEHENIYWDGESDSINDGYSPNHDALYAGKMVGKMYQSWYKIPVLEKNKEPMLLEMVTHALIPSRTGMTKDNAAWDGERMYFGDGEKEYYPLTSLGVAAHEISHGFTEQNSDLDYDAQSGGLNEAFSDMAAQAIEFFVNGHNSWTIGAEIKKDNKAVLRYMDQPSKDCGGMRILPGRNCSMDNVETYKQYVEEHANDFSYRTRYPNPHYSSGIFNRAFYLISASPKWDVRKAFNVMVHANRFYWTKTSSFSHAACGVLKAASDYRYDIPPVVRAFDKVGVDTSRCAIRG